MSDSNSKRDEPLRSPLRLIEEVHVTSEDLARASVIPLGECPRRYCWWWASLSFDWDVLPSVGCIFLNAKKHPDWKYADIPCCRSDPTSPLDHFEPRGLYIAQDGIDPSGWLAYQQDMNTTFLREHGEEC